MERLNIKKTPVTFIIIAINILIFMYVAYLSGGEPTVRVMKRVGALARIYIDDGQYWRLVSSMFLHWGIQHLLMNMFSLWALGKDLERIVGSIKFALIYFISGIGGGFFSAYLNERTISAGASGAVFGIIGSMIVVAVALRGRAGNQYLMNLILITVVNLASGFTPGSGIDNMGHIGGLVTGLVLTILIIASGAVKLNTTNHKIY